MAALLSLAATAATVTVLSLSLVTGGSALARVVCGAACFAALYVGMAALSSSTRTLYTKPWRRRATHASVLASSQP
jgi:polyferredoxin